MVARFSGELGGSGLIGLLMAGVPRPAVSRVRWGSSPGWPGRPGAGRSLRAPRRARRRWRGRWRGRAITVPGGLARCRGAGTAGMAVNLVGRDQWSDVGDRYVAGPSVTAVEIFTPGRRRRCAGWRCRPGSRPGFLASAGRRSPGPGSSVSMRMPGAGLLTAVQDGLPGDLGEVKRLPLLDPPLAAGQGEQRVDEAFLCRPVPVPSRRPIAASRVASGSASATCSRVRSAVSGVRSSWEALATKCRCAWNDASSRANRSLSVSPSW